jgi:hypothetical protein
LSLPTLDIFLHLSDSVAEIKSMPSTSLSATLPPPPFLPPPFPPSNHLRSQSPCVPSFIDAHPSLLPSFQPLPRPRPLHFLWLPPGAYPVGQWYRSGREGGRRQKATSFPPTSMASICASCLVRRGRAGGREGGREGE